MISSNKLKMQEISFDEVNSLIDYFPQTGCFVWKVSVGSKSAGSDAGCLNPTTGYWTIRIDRIGYSAHRIAWLLYYGYLPENGIDHIDRNKINNKISNLREVSQSCNRRNASKRSDNTSGVTGVSWHKHNKVFEATIFIDGKTMYIKGSKDFDEAVAYRLAAEQCLGFTDCNSNSQAYQYVKKWHKLRG